MILYLFYATYSSSSIASGYFVLTDYFIFAVKEKIIHFIGGS